MKVARRRVCLQTTKNLHECREGFYVNGMSDDLVDRRCMNLGKIVEEI